ncbi:uncharacterized protein LOC105630963 isoform X2 [Jatropha curcas]|uniref:uncharacterized protein LOC105630963 isoform X2 n=1 Tax=Jatropha curcas TaxID=180498 RepID=UPI0009D77302|nr:uncharacterized protein LOC105630963 isoform X2 [Jatropha curcas]
MAKPKEEEEEKEEEKPDGLEIISVGSLYSGPWDKKYWSSSRGKDRYPYPVGYQARRAYNGGTYKMEIQEGHKGPLFVITSADGHLCSGQTADIAWDKFQKKGCPRMKIWHGKRFLCKIDGIEFFGFRNPFVQRLLRELVANVNGVAEHSLLPSGTCNGASNMEHNNQCQDSHTCSDLLPYLSRPQVTGKRSKRFKIIDPKSLGIDGLKRLRAGNLKCIVEPSNSINGNPKQGSSSSPSTCSFHLKDDSCRLLGASSTGVQSDYATGGENSHLAKDGLSSKSVDYSDHLGEKTVPVYEESKLASSEDNKSTVVQKFSAEENPLDRVRESELEGFNFPASMEIKALGALCPEESPSVHDIDLWAPDTLDFVQDTANSGPRSCDKFTRVIKEEIMATEVADSEELANKPYPKEEMGTSSSHLSSERSDFDSVGQDIAKSMMTVLLPQAIPLLKKTSSKKKRIVSPPENLPSIPALHEENNETGFFVEAQFAGVDHSVLKSSEFTKSNVLDTLDDEQREDHIMDQLILPSNNVEADQPSFGKDAYHPEIEKQLININVKESWVSHVETRGGRDILHDDKMQMNLSKRSQDGDLQFSESILGCMSICKKVPSEVNQDVCKNLVENSLGGEIHSDDFKAASHCNEGTSDASAGALGSSVHLLRKDTVTNTGASGIGNISISQPKKVYTRKKVPNTDPMVRKHSPSLLESVGCGKFVDGYIPETTGALLQSEPSYTSFSVDRLHKKELLSADTRVGEQFHDLHTDKTTITSNPVFDSHAHLISQTQKSDCPSEGQNTSNLFVRSTEKPKPHFKVGLVGDETTSDANNPGSEKQGTLFCHNKTLISKEVQGSSELKKQRNLELNNELEDAVEFLGCYFHPMPVLLLLLSRKGNEIYICAVCGLPVDKNRTLFLYKLAVEEPKIGCPYFVGHTSVAWPSSTDIFGREIAFERSGLQLTPDGKCLVLLGNTRTPYCREGRIDCLCSTCTTDCNENSTVKIVQVQDGYVSVLLKLRTTDSLQCILVCEPDHIIAAGESRGLNLWTMNSTWSAPTEEFTITSNDYISPCIMELKRIPECASLVIGHNGFGEFTLWDISRRIFVSRFSTPGTSVCQFCPISWFSWQREVHASNYPNVAAHINRLIDATKVQFSEHSKNHSFPPLKGEDVAIWCLVSTALNTDAQHKYESSASQINPIGWWRLALLVKNTIILGSALDTRVSAIGTSAGHGIIGTLDGLVYMWELLTGDKLGTLHKFKGGSVSCIAADDSGSGVVAVADESGQLLVYHKLKR